MTRTTAAFIDLDDLLPSPTNIRSRLNKIDELAASVRQHGILQNLLVVPAANGKYRIVCGHRRRAAAEKVGLTGAPCNIRHENRSNETALMVCENAQREDLDPVDFAKALSDLRKDYTLAEVASMTGFSQATIRARLALLDLPPEVQDMVSDHQITLGDAAGLVAELKTKGSGSARIGGTRKTVPHFDTTHRLADHVAARCTHRDSQRRILGPGCGQCWEDTIRADAVGSLDNVTPMPYVPAKPEHPWDDAAVERAISGDPAGLRLGVGEREEIVRRLVKQGFSDSRIAEKAMTTSKTVERIRGRLNIAPAIEPSRPDHRERTA